MRFKCKICGYEYMGDVTKKSAAWTCPECGVPKTYFEKIENNKPRVVEFKSDAGDEPIYIDVNKDSQSLCRKENLCVYCGNCKLACKSQGVYGKFDSKKIKCKSICIDCGQCTLKCPTGAINYKNDIEKVKNCLKNKEKTVIFQIAPAVRVALGEMLALPSGFNCEGKIVAALKSLGADYVFDTTFGADLTIMEEATELIERLNGAREENTKGIMPPTFTSCCPAWVKFAEIFYPEILKSLSTAKSPILMQGAIIKTYFAKMAKIAPEDIISIAITPCTAKKAEIAKVEMCASGRFHNKPLRDVDIVLTLRELAELIKQENIDFKTLAEENFDSPLGKASGGGVIFGKSGGVMESALRTLHYFMTGQNLQKPIEFRGSKGIKEAYIEIQDKKLHIAVVSGSANVHKIIDKIRKGEHYDFIEVMACPGGCLGGGGTPKLGMSDMTVLNDRSEALTKMDENSKFRAAHENKEIQELYQEFLKAPCSNLAKKLLHTSYVDKSDMLGK